MKKKTEKIIVIVLACYNIIVSCFLVWLVIKTFKIITK